MYEYYFVFRSVTRAQRGVLALQTQGVSASLVPVARTLLPTGCGYAVKVKAADAYQAAAYFRMEKIEFQKVYRASYSRVEEVYL